MVIAYKFHYHIGFSAFSKLVQRFLILQVSLIPGLFEFILYISNGLASSWVTGTFMDGWDYEHGLLCNCI